MTRRIPTSRGAPRPPPSVELREATAEDHLAVVGVLDAALLSTGDVTARIDAGDVLVATTDRRVLGALVLDPAPDVGNESVDLDAVHVTAIAVRRSRRGQGIGTALVGAAAARAPVLTATFDERVRQFYESLGFAIEPDGDRYRGVFGPAQTSDP